MQKMKTLIARADEIRNGESPRLPKRKEEE
jgi:hypothetical protein